MKTRWISLALFASAALANAQTTPAASTPVSAAKKELVQKLLVLQQPGIEGVARSLVERPAGQMMQQAGQVLQTQVPPEKREAAGKSIEADAKKFIDEAAPLVRDRAIKLAPATIGPMLEERFTEDELKVIIAWFESPVNKKYQQAAGDMQNSFLQKLVPDARPLVDPKLQALEGKIRTTLMAATGASAPAGSSGNKSADKPAAKAPAPSKAASK